MSFCLRPKSRQEFVLSPAFNTKRKFKAPACSLNDSTTGPGKGETKQAVTSCQKCVLSNTHPVVQLIQAIHHLNPARMLANSYSSHLNIIRGNLLRLLPHDKWFQL